MTTVANKKPTFRVRDHYPYLLQLLEAFRKREDDVLDSEQRNLRFENFLDELGVERNLSGAYITADEASLIRAYLDPGSVVTDPRDSKLTIPVKPSFDVPGYEKLADVLTKAYDQSARGKGRERHANDKPFLEQPIFGISRMVGLGGLTYQVCKKAQEATGMHERGSNDAAQAELLGVIVYAAAAYLLIEEKKPRS